MSEDRRCVHFVRFDNAHGSAYQNAVMAFGAPDFLHRKWDRRARREIAEGDLVVFAKGDSDQLVSQHNGDDEYYAAAQPMTASAPTEGR